MAAPTPPAEAQVVGGDAVEALRQSLAILRQDSAPSSARDAAVAKADTAIAALSAQPRPLSAEDRFEQFVQAEIARSPEPLRELGEYLGRVLDEDQFPAANRLLLQLATLTPKASAPVGVEGVPDPVAVKYPDSGLRDDAHALALWDAHGYDTGGDPLFSAEQMQAAMAAQQPAAVDEVPLVLREALAQALLQPPMTETRAAAIRRFQTLAGDYVHGLIDHLAQPQGEG